VLEHTTTDGLVLVSLLAGGGLVILVAGTGCRVGGGGGLEHRAEGLEGRSWGKGLHRSGCGCWGRETLHRGGGGGCRGHIGPNWSWSRCSLLENRSWGRGGELTGGRVRSHGCGGGSWSIIVIARIGDGTSNHSQSQDEEFLPDKIGKYINIPSNTILSWHILTIFADLFALGATNRIMSSVSSSCTFIQSGESARPNGSAEYHKSTKHFSRRKICLIRQTDTSRPRHQMGLVFIS